MSEAKSTTPATAKQPANTVRVVGKIEAISRYDGVNSTRIICPAADAYSRPQIVQIRSKSRLGTKDEEVDVVARLGGYVRKAYKVTDKETGEISSVIPVDMTLDLVE